MKEGRGGDKGATGDGGRQRQATHPLQKNITMAVCRPTMVVAGGATYLCSDHTRTVYDWKFCTTFWKARFSRWPTRPRPCIGFPRKSRRFQQLWRRTRLGTYGHRGSRRWGSNRIQLRWMTLFMVRRAEGDGDGKINLK